MKKALNTILEELNLMAEGILAYLTELVSVGVTEDTATLFKESKARLEKLNAEQEELKALLKTKTAELAKEEERISKIYSDTRKLVKIKIDQKQWRTFGIEDKR